MTHICVNEITSIGSDNGLSPGRRQAIIWTNAGILLIRTLGTKSSEILRKMHIFSFKKMHLKMSSAKCRQICLNPNVLKTVGIHDASHVVTGDSAGRVSKTTTCGTASHHRVGIMGLLPDTYNCGLSMRRQCWERFPHHQLKWKPLLSTRGACATRNFTYLVRGPW